MAASPRRSNRPRAAAFTTPLTIPGGDVAGAEVVGELAPEVALPVWQTLRSVLMWAGEEPAMRGDLFEPCAMGDWERELLQETWEPDVRCPLAVLVGELAKPAEASAETIARACLCVTDWALERGHVATALAFAEAAALAWPQHARFSWLAGRLLRRHGRLREAEMWIRRASRAAASASDWETQTLAQNSLGNVLHDLGKNPQSMKTLRDALRLARRHRLRSLEGEILHDLFVVATWGGQPEGADEYAQGAFEIYREGHPRLAALAHDVASLWIIRGYYSRALTVLRQLPPFIQLPDEQIKVWGALARAAASCRDLETYHRAANEIWTLQVDPETLPRAASALLELAMGASVLEEWDEAERAVGRAIEIAARTGEADIQFRAEEVLAAINDRKPDEADEVGSSATDIRHARHADALVEGFLSSLSDQLAVAV
jgi:tetratricopeptide (TPR) repeat protein